MTAVEAARRAFSRIVSDGAHADPDNPQAYIAFPDDVAALRVLFAEIDSGVWLDTREMDALAEAGGVSIIPEGRSRMHRWEVWVNNGGPVTTHSTFADAVRAAREATGE